MRMAIWASRLLMGCTPIATARQAFAVRPAPARRLEPRSALRKPDWGSRWGERDRDARVRALRARDTGLRLSWSRDSQLCSRDPSPPQSAVWTPRGRGLFIRGALLVRVRSVSVLGGREEAGEVSVGVGAVKAAGF